MIGGKHGWISPRTSLAVQQQDWEVIFLSEVSGLRVLGEVTALSVQVVPCAIENFV